MYILHMVDTVTTFLFNNFVIRLAISCGLGHYSSQIARTNSLLLQQHCTVFCGVFTTKQLQNTRIIGFCSIISRYPGSSVSDMVHQGSQSSRTYSLLLLQHSTGCLRSSHNKIASKYSNYRFLFNNFRYSGSSMSHMRGMRAGGPTQDVATLSQEGLNSLRSPGTVSLWCQGAKNKKSHFFLLCSVF